MRKGLIVTIALSLIFLLGIPLAEAQKGPITVGLLLPVTGPQAANGKDMVNGFQLFLDEQGGKLAGREVKVLIEDDESKPATGLTKLRGTVEGQGVHVLMGPLSAAVGYALRDYIESKKFPPEQRDSHFSKRFAVLDIQARRVSKESRLLITRPVSIARRRVDG
jgi:Periplasmic binding protein